MIVLLVEADTKEEYIEKWDKFREEVKEKIWSRRLLKTEKVQ
jgi:hypothetical protein